MVVLDDRSDENNDRDLSGVFWEPDTPASPLHGVLHLSSDGDKLTLTLPENGHRADLREERTEPISRLYGMLEGKGEVTIVDASPTGGSRSNAHVTAVDFWQFTTLFGSHTDSKKFHRLNLEFEWLGEWTPNRALSGPTQDDKFEVDLSSETIAIANWDGVRLSLERFVARSWSLDEVTVRNKWLFRVEAEGAISEVSREWLAPLQDFLLIALGYRPGVLRVGVETDDPNPYTAWVEARPWWPPLGTSGATPTLVRYLPQTKTLLLPDDELLPLGEALKIWFAKRAELRVVVSMLSSGLRDRHIALDHRFLSLFLALDALARQSGEIDLQAMPAQAHHARVSAIAAVLAGSDVPKPTQDWAINRLRDGNAKSQPMVLAEFLKLTGLLTDDKAVSTAKRLNRYRTDIAHRGVIKGIDRDEIVLEVIHLTELLEWIVRAEVLVNLGFVRDGMRQRLVANASFREVLESRKWRTSTSEALGTSEY